MTNPLEIAPPGSSEDSPQLARFSRISLLIGLILVFLGSLDIILELRKINPRDTASVLNNLININESAYLPLLGIVIGLLPLARHIPRPDVMGRALLTWVALVFCTLHVLVVPCVVVSTIKARNLIQEKENRVLSERHKIFEKARDELDGTKDRQRLQDIIKPLISDPKFFEEPDTEVLRVRILDRLGKVRAESDDEVRDKIDSASLDLMVTALQHGLTATLLAIAFYLTFFFGRPWREMSRT